MRLDEDTVKKQIETVYRFPEPSERTAWKRKQKKMDKLIEKLKPIEEKIMELYMQKNPIMDEIAKLRKIMVQECVHPKEYLVHKGTHIECKFCEKLLRVIENSDEEQSTTPGFSRGLEGVAHAKRETES